MIAMTQLTFLSSGPAMILKLAFIFAAIAGSSSSSFAKASAASSQASYLRTSMHAERQQQPNTDADQSKGSSGGNGNDAQPTTALRRRRQLTTVATTQCNAIRQNTYLAELQLTYSYEAEFQPDSSRSLGGLQDALIRAVAEALNDCDANDRPLFQVRTDGRHTFSKTGSCVPEGAGTTCSIINGSTLILLDSNSNLAKRNALSAIEASLADTAFLNGFDASIARAKYLKLIRDTLVVAPLTDGKDEDDPDSLNPTTTSIIIASATVTFIAASIFCYGFIRRERRFSPNPTIRNRFLASRRSMSATLVSPMRQTIEPRRHFFPLEEPDLTKSFPLEALPAARFDISAGQYVFTDDANQQYIDDGNGLGENHLHSPTVTSWSISDISSESGSILSALSRTTSMLERIEESEEEGETWDDGSSSYQPRERKRHQARKDSEKGERGSSKSSSKSGKGKKGKNEQRAKRSNRRKESTYFRKTVELYDCEFQNQPKMEISLDVDTIPDDGDDRDANANVNDSEEATNSSTDITDGSQDNVEVQLVSKEPHTRNIAAAVDNPISIAPANSDLECQDAEEKDENENQDGGTRQSSESQPTNEGDVATEHEAPSKPDSSPTNKASLVPNDHTASGEKETDVDSSGEVGNCEVVLREMEPIQHASAGVGTPMGDVVGTDTINVIVTPEKKQPENRSKQVAPSTL